MPKKIFLFITVFLVVLLGCAPRITIKTPKPGAPLQISGDEALAFGRIRWIQNGEERKNYSDITLSVLKADDKKTAVIHVEADGSFFAVLPRGYYIMYELDWRDSWDGPHWLVPQVAFKATDDQQAYYLGTLIVDIETTRDIIGGLWIKGFRIWIDDEEVQALEALRTRHPNQEITVAKLLMIHDAIIPRVEELEKQRLMLDIMRSLYFGIVPTILY